jgi:hypothetical protein
MDEGRKRLIGIMAAILLACTCRWQMICSEDRTESLGTDKLIAASVQRAEEVMRKIDSTFREAK